MLEGRARESQVSPTQSRNIGNSMESSSSESETSSESSDNGSKGDNERPLKWQRLKVDQETGAVDDNTDDSDNNTDVASNLNDSEIHNVSFI
jgi:hypothetical protein